MIVNTLRQCVLGSRKPVISLLQFSVLPVRNSASRDYSMKMQAASTRPWSPLLASTSSSVTQHFSARFSSESESRQEATEGEKRIRSLLAKQFPKAVRIDVADVSGGCGSMYAVGVRSSEFRGLSKVDQHRKVNEVSSESRKLIKY